MKNLGGRSTLRIASTLVVLICLVFVVWQFDQFDLNPWRRLPTGERDGTPVAAAVPAVPAVPAEVKNAHALQPAVPVTKHPSNELSKVIVMGALAKDNISWVQNELPGWDRAIYIVDAQENRVSTEFQVPLNKGNEANAYLWYIITHYEKLPDVMVFMHSHRDGKVRAWHVDNTEHSNVLSLQFLRLDMVQRHGFANLRCIQIPGCPTGIRPTYDGKGISNPPVTADWLPGALRSMFPDGFPAGLAKPAALRAKPASGNALAYPEVIAAPCCAQFAVSRDQVLQRPKSDYERFHHWVMAAEMDNYSSGRVMEYLWHIIFGRDPYYCPRQSECACNNYNAGCSA